MLLNGRFCCASWLAPPAVWLARSQLISLVPPHCDCRMFFVVLPVLTTSNLGHTAIEDRSGPWRPRHFAASLFVMWQRCLPKQRTVLAACCFRCRRLCLLNGLCRCHPCTPRGGWRKARADDTTFHPRGGAEGRYDALDGVLPLAGLAKRGRVDGALLQCLRVDQHLAGACAGVGIAYRDDGAQTSKASRFLASGCAQLKHNQGVAGESRTGCRSGISAKIACAALESASFSPRTHGTSQRILVPNEPPLEWTERRQVQRAISSALGWLEQALRHRAIPMWMR